MSPRKARPPWTPATTAYEDVPCRDCKGLGEGCQRCGTSGTDPIPKKVFKR